jgi:hypothetical protein
MDASEWYAVAHGGGVEEADGWEGMGVGWVSSSVEGDDGGSDDDEGDEKEEEEEEDDYEAQARIYY